MDTDRIPYIRVSQDVLDQFTAWFPDCCGIVDVGESIDAMYGHEIDEGPIFELLMVLERDGIERFTPYSNDKAPWRDDPFFAYLETVRDKTNIETEQWDAINAAMHEIDYLHSRIEKLKSWAQYVRKTMGDEAFDRMQTQSNGG